MYLIVVLDCLLLIGTEILLNRIKLISQYRFVIVFAIYSYILAWFHADRIFILCWQEADAGNL